MNLQAELARIGSFFEGIVPHLPAEAQGQATQAVDDLKGLAETAVTAGATAIAGPIFGPEIAGLVDDALAGAANNILANAQARVEAIAKARAAVAAAATPPAA